MTIKDSPSRVDAARKVIEASGGKLVDFYYTFGKYDFVAIAEASNDEAFLGAILTIAKQGNTTLQTLKAFTLDQVKGIIKKIP